jgi:hypothetical protein
LVDSSYLAYEEQARFSPVIPPPQSVDSSYLAYEEQARFSPVIPPTQLVDSSYLAYEDDARLRPVKINSTPLPNGSYLARIQTYRLRGYV